MSTMSERSIQDFKKFDDFYRKETSKKALATLSVYSRKLLEMYVQREADMEDLFKMEATEKVKVETLQGIHKNGIKDVVKLLRSIQTNKNKDPDDKELDLSQNVTVGGNNPRFGDKFCCLNLSRL